DPAIRNRCPKCQRNRGCLGITVLVDGDNYLLKLNSKLFRRRLNDPAVGLMRDKPVQVVGSNAALRENVFNDIRDHSNGMLEDFAALHPQMSDGPSRLRTAIDKELFFVAAVGAQ